MEKDERLVMKVKRVLYKYCPYTDDRLDLIDSGNRPEFDIQLYLGKEMSQVYFVYGNHRAKTMVENGITIPRNVELEEIEELIDFIKEDHKCMIFDKNDTYKSVAEFKFDINWGGEESIKGINCSTIGLVIDYQWSRDLGKKYLYFLNEKYFDSKDIKSKWNYTDDVLRNYIDSLDKDGLMYLLNRMNEEDLKKLLVPNIKEIFEYVKDDPKVKEYFIEKPGM